MDASVPARLFVLPQPCTATLDACPEHLSQAKLSNGRVYIGSMPEKLFQFFDFGRG